MHASFHAQKIASALLMPTAVEVDIYLFEGDFLDLESPKNNYGGWISMSKLNQKVSYFLVKLNICSLYIALKTEVINSSNCFREEKSAYFGDSLAYYCCSSSTLVLFWFLLCATKAKKQKYDSLANAYHIPHCIFMQLMLIFSLCSGSKDTHENLLLLDLHSHGAEYKKGAQVGKGHGEEKNDGYKLPIFSFSSIVASTNNFSITNKLGEGGFGPVYKVINPCYAHKKV